MSINKTAVFAVFTDADNLSATFTDRLLTLGLGDRATARPFAMEWAAAKYGVKIVEGQRGNTLPRDSAAERAMNRVLSICFPSVDMTKPTTKKPTANKVDPVKSLVTRYTKLSAAEKRRFLASI
jgi:hypothetical protein